METYQFVGLLISTSLPFILKLFTILRKSECMMCGCCVYKTNNDDDLSDMEGDDSKPNRKSRDGSSPPVSIKTE